MNITPQTKRIIDDIDNTFIVMTAEELKLHVAEVKDVIMNGYDGLSSRVTELQSKTDPGLFRDTFKKKLDDFVFLEVVNKSHIKFHSPDMNTFDFKGIPLVEQVLEGTSGIYVEVTQEDLEKMKGTNIVNQDPIDPDAPKQKRIYLVRYSDKVRQEEKNNLEKNLVKFPFSNTPPLDNTVFGEGENFVRDNLDTWISEATRKSTDMMSIKYRGVQ